MAVHATAAPAEVFRRHPTEEVRTVASGSSTTTLSSKGAAIAFWSDALGCGQEGGSAVRATPSLTRARSSTDPTLPARPSVLLIDDAVRAGDPLVRWLTLDGFAVELAASGAAGLALARSRLYDAIVLDLCLPDIPGLTVLEELRSHGMMAPVIAVTGYYLEVAYAVSAMKGGAADFSSSSRSMPRSSRRRLERPFVMHARTLSGNPRRCEICGTS